MTVAFQRMFGILERWNNNKFTQSLSKPRELSYRSNTLMCHRRVSETLRLSLLSCELLLRKL